MEAKRRLLNEIEALHELIEDLDYYGVLLVDRDCAPHEIGDTTDASHGGSIPTACRRSARP